MARHETNFEAAEEARLTPREALSINGDAGATQSSRGDALACFLSAADGWDEAARRLSGAFADMPRSDAKKD